MTLFLSSTGLGARPALLRELARGPRVGVVLDADNAEGADVRVEAWEQESADLAAAGFDPVDIDLRVFRGDPGQLAARLADLDVLWVAGGNTFDLMRAMQACGLRGALAPLVHAGTLVYAGYSAGACVAGPDLRGVHLMDPPGDQGAADVVDETLRLVDIRIVPHWRSGHRLSPAAEAMSSELEGAGLAHRCLEDGQVLLVDNGVARLA